jgi:hypothetical protein
LQVNVALVRQVRLPSTRKHHQSVEVQTTVHEGIISQQRTEVRLHRSSGFFKPQGRQTRPNVPQCLLGMRTSLVAELLVRRQNATNRRSKPAGYVHSARAAAGVCAAAAEVPRKRLPRRVV